MTTTHAESAYDGPWGLGRSREILAITILTLAGGVVRVWSLGRLGLIHFDEGIYALAGLWSLAPGGLHSLDPRSIAYAPPGFPILVGIFYLWFGIADTTAILVSVVLGTATIPVVAWLSLRTFGRGAGGAAAALAAFAGVHVSFSRMALTDASFLFVFLLALGQGQRFLERPNSVRAVFLGLSVGIAQLFKYNGWISGLIVVLALSLKQTVQRREQSARAVIAAWERGLLAISVAAVVYWPWYQFVELHGGYRALLAHQQGYMNGISTWLDHCALQLAQARVLSGSLRWRGSLGIAAALALVISSSNLRGGEDQWLKRPIEVFGLASMCAVPNVEWWTPLCWIGFLAITRTRSATPAMLVLGVGWLTLSSMTPFYHPYARLWLPLHALGWVVIGGLFLAARSWLDLADRGPKTNRKRRLIPVLGFCAIGLAAFAISVTSALPRRNDLLPGILAPTDSLKLACRALPRQLPKHVSELRLLARPAVAFYLSLENHLILRSQPDLEHLLEPPRSPTWCVVDSALIRQDGRSPAEVDRMSNHWLVAGELPSSLSLPTLLDVDPGSSYGGRIELSAPLLLLRPAQPEVIR